MVLTAQTEGKVLRTDATVSDGESVASACDEWTRPR